MSKNLPQVEDVKEALARLVAEEPTAKSRATIELASESIQDIEHAAAFVAADGVTRLDQAIVLAQRTDDRRLVRSGQRALAAFERFRDAATDDPNRTTDRFQSVAESL